MFDRTYLKSLAATLALFTAAGAMAQVDNPEVEPNNIKSQGTPAESGENGMAPGDTISGLSTGATSTGVDPATADYYKVRTAAAPLGLYKYRLVLSSDTLLHTATIRGLTQAAATGINPTSDAILQTSITTSNPPRYVQWYGFGRQEQLYYRVAGTAASTSPYVATLERSEITPEPGPSLVVEGGITISTVGRTGATQINTDMWLYDAEFNAIVDAGNESEPAPGLTTGALLSRTLTPGVYNLAISVTNLANNLASPTDDRVRTGAVTDFADIVVDSSTALNQNVSFRITDGAGVNHDVAATKAEAFDVVWVSFTVVPFNTPRPPTATGAAMPAAAFNDGTGSSLLTVTVSPGVNPDSTGITATADLSGFGGSAMQMLFDDGTNGDVSANDNIFSFLLNVPANQAPGAGFVPYTFADGQGRNGSGSIGLTIANVVDLGDITQSTEIITTPLNLDPAGVSWIKFITTGAADASIATFLDIDTEGTTNDTELGLYRADGTLVTTDDDDGDGLHSQLSYGAGTRPAVGAGTAYNGRDGTLPPGTYYLALSLFNSVFNTTDFNVVGAGVGASGVPVNIRSGLVASGACCTAEGCTIKSQALCASQGGTYLGDATVCSTGDGYVMGPSMAVFEDISSNVNAVQRILTDDSTVTADIGFDFVFFGQSFSQVNVCSNGFIQFGGASTTFTNGVIPAAAIPNNCMYVCWDDLNPVNSAAPNGVFTLSEGTAPNRRFVASWQNIPQFTLTDANNFQVILHEDGRAEFVYGSMTDQIAGDITCGIENADGTVASTFPDPSDNGGNIAFSVLFALGQSNCPNVEPCDIDFNNDGIVEPGDLDDFITFFFSDVEAERALCDFNNDGLVEPGDLDDFITAFFGGC
ncbi:MAG: hypothetical protein ACT4PL_14185 [Phycisphaerales bacterium]